MNIVNQFTIKPYSIFIQDNTSNGSFLRDSNTSINLLIHILQNRMFRSLLMNHCFQMLMVPILSIVKRNQSPLVVDITYWLKYYYYSQSNG